MRRFFDYDFDQILRHDGMVLEQNLLVIDYRTVFTAPLVPTLDGLDIALTSPINDLTLNNTSDDFAGNTSTTGSILLDGTQVMGTIEFEGDTDWFRFDITQDNSTVLFSIDATDPLLINRALDVYDDTGFLLLDGEVERAGDTLEFFFEFSGTYYLEMSAIGTSDMGAYTLSASGNAGADDYAADSSTTGILQLHTQNISGVIETAGDRDWFAFDVTNNSHLLIVSTSALPDEVLTIFDSAGNALIESQTGPGEEVRVDYLFDTAGTYFVEYRAGPSATGEYAVFGIPTSDDFGATIDSAGIGGADGVSVEAELDFEGDIDVFSYTVNANTTLVFSTTFSLPGSLHLRLLDDTGAELAVSNADSEIISYSFSSDEVIYIEVQSLSSEIGRYGLVSNEYIDPFTEGDDVADGTEGNDVLDALGGNDTVNGLGGNDIIFGRGGIDTLNGGDGDDILDGGNGVDVIDAGAGDDTIILGGIGADIIDGGAGFDIVTYDNTGLLGSIAFFATLSPINSLNVVRFDGTAVVRDILTNVERFEQSANGVLEGLALQLDDTNNVLDLSTEAITGYASVFAGAGDDIITAGSAYDGTIGTLGDGDIANTFYGGAGLDTLTGNIYSDIIEGGAGADILDGGAGIDRVGYYSSDAAVTVDLTTNSVSGGHATGDVISNFENVDGSEFDDMLTGNAISNDIDGRGGDDTIYGGAGDDTLSGGDGTNTLTGGIGSDTFLFRTHDFLSGVAITFNDVITDIEATDIIQFSSDTSLTPPIFIGTAAFTNVINQVRFEVAGGQTLIELDTDGDGITDSTVTLNGEFDITQVANTPIDISLTATAVSSGPINGTPGDDVLNGTAGDDVINGLDGNDTINGFAGNDIINGFGGDDILNGGDGDDTIDGGDGHDILDGGAGNDTLIGGRFNDTFIGGAGADTLLGDIGTDIVDYSAASARVIINYEIGGLGSDAEGDTYTSIETFLLTSFNDEINGFTGGRAIVRGNAGNDVIDITGANRDSIADGGSGNDIIYGSSGQTRLGGDGDDILFSSQGTNTFNGGDGFDTIDFSNFDEFVFGVTSDLQSNRTGLSSRDTYVSIEGINGTIGDDALSGNSSDNLLRGRAGNDILNGRAGDDTLVGGDGDDIAVFGRLARLHTLVDNGDGTYSITANFGSDGTDILDGIEVLSFSDQMIAIQFFNLGAFTEGDDVVDGSFIGDTVDALGGNDTVNGLGGDDIISGGAGADILNGGDGNDVLEGGLGDDIIDGEAGIDTLSYASSTARVIINLALGTTSGGHADGDVIFNFENVMASDFNDVLTGNDGSNSLDGGIGNDILGGGAGDDILNGGDGADRLIGGEGADALNGGAGFDSVDYRGAASGVRFNVDTGGTLGEAAGDTFSGIERYYLSNFNDIITGSDANEFFFGEDGNDQINGGGGIDRIYGGDGNDIQRGQEGNDTLYGSAGNDQLNGGTGFDVANYSLATSAVIVNLASGGTGGDAAGDTYFGIEAVYGSDFDDSLTGNNSSNELRGGDGDDMLFGLGGNDRFFGGEGADSFDGGTGIDTVNYTLATSFVWVNLTSSGTFGEAHGDSYTSIEWVFGSSFDDRITGDAGNNRLEGRDGDDDLDGGAGNDRLLGGDGNDFIQGGDGIDTIFGGDGDDMLDGGAGNDFFFGDAGADMHNGGAGIDTVSYLNSSMGLTVNISGIGSASTGDAAGDYFFGIERIFGSGFDDILIGGADAVTLIGNGGNDYLQGGDENDSLIGGAGVDSYGFDENGISSDVILGFTTNETIYLLGNSTDFDTWAEVQAVGTDVGANVIFDFGFGTTLTIVGQSLADLDASNFNFSGTPPSGEPLDNPDAFAAGIVDVFDMDALI